MDCPICLESQPLESRIQLSCNNGHAVCQACYHGLEENNHFRCPLCRNLLAEMRPAIRRYFQRFSPITVMGVLRRICSILNITYDLETIPSDTKRLSVNVWNNVKDRYEGDMSIIDTAYYRLYNQEVISRP